MTSPVYPAARLIVSDQQWTAGNWLCEKRHRTGMNSWIQAVRCAATTRGRNMFLARRIDRQISAGWNAISPASPFLAFRGCRPAPRCCRWTRRGISPAADRDLTSSRRLWPEEKSPPEWESARRRRITVFKGGFPSISLSGSATEYGRDFFKAAGAYPALARLNGLSYLAYAQELRMATRKIASHYRSRGRDVSERQSSSRSSDSSSQFRICKEPLTE